MNRDENILWYSYGEDVKALTIYPLADVHLGAQGCHSDAFYKLLAKIKDEPDSRVILLGDLIDNGTRNSVTDIFKATMPPSQQKREMANALEPIRSQIIAILPGNHERRSGKDADDCPAYDIASKLDLEDRYRESIAFVRIALGKRTSGKLRDKKQWTYYIAATHGAGGGALPGSGINRADNFMQALDGIDIFIHGHTHKPYTLPGSKLVTDTQNKLVRRRATLTMGVNSWLDYVGYPVDKMLRPTAIPKASRLILYGREYLFEGIV